MPPLHRPGLAHGRTPEPDPKLDFTLKLTPDQISHLFMGIANLQAYRHADPEEGIDILPDSHPLVQMQEMIISQLEPLIAIGIVRGWNVAGLLEIKEAIAGAAATMAEELDGDEG